MTLNLYLYYIYIYTYMHMRVIMPGHPQGMARPENMLLLFRPARLVYDSWKRPRRPGPFFVHLHQGRKCDRVILKKRIKKRWAIVFFIDNIRLIRPCKSDSSEGMCSTCPQSWDDHVVVSLVEKSDPLNTMLGKAMEKNMVKTILFPWNQPIDRGW